MPEIDEKQRTKRVDRAAFAKRYGARPDDIAAVRAFAQRNGLVIVQEDAARRTIVLSGTVTKFNAAFGVDLQRFEYDGGSYRGRVGTVNIPDELHDRVTAVLGLDNRPQARAHYRMRHPEHATYVGNVHKRPPSATTAFTPPQLASLYNFPAGDGSGECVAIVELGVGYRTADVNEYFTKLNVKAPNLLTVSVDHATNHPTGNPDGPDGEVMLDIEVAGAVAPGATLAVYFAPNTDAGFLNAITTAVHDTVNNPSVISISWGGPESSWTQQAMQAFDEAFQSAAAMGITVCVASGDDGSTDGVKGSANHADFPASSTYALACGGTTLRATNGSIASEVVWNDGTAGGATGGGVSSVFPLPKWQRGLQITMSDGSQQALKARGIPDVCGDADPQTGYDVRVDGQDAVFGGTSAVAPLWAGLLARINSQRSQPVGYINPTLYGKPNALNDITQGDNGGYAAAVGWDACSGLGSPDGTKLKQML